MLNDQVVWSDYGVETQTFTEHQLLENQTMVYSIQSLVEMTATRGRSERLRI